MSAWHFIGAVGFVFAVMCMAYCDRTGKNRRAVLWFLIASAILAVLTYHAAPVPPHSGLTHIP